MTNRLLLAACNERPTYLLLALLSKIVSQVLGRGHAQLLGWRGGYIGRGSRVIGSRSISVGDNAYINRYAWIEAVHGFRGQAFTPCIRIGRGFSASDQLHISCVELIEIGDHCLFGSGVYIGDHNHGAYNGADQSSPLQAPVDRELRFTGSVSIGSNVWLGDNVVIVGPVNIGSGAIIGANSVVKQDVPANTIAAGAPLRLLKQFHNESGTWDRYES
jgi:lipopolysaccharide O-acetyltransferase